MEKKKKDKTKKKILVDLDVVTVGIWDKKSDHRTKIAIDFIRRVESKEFFVITPFFLLELISKWKYSQLKDYIVGFYIKSADKILTNEEIDQKIKSINVNDKRIIAELKSHGIKGEDSLLVFITSIFDIDNLITFNRIHLKDKKEIINEVLKNNGIRTINLIGPEEV